MINIKNNIKNKDWDDWQWQQAHRLRDKADIEPYLKLTHNEKKACVEATKYFRMAITPYYFSLINPDNPNDPIRLQCIPRLEELNFEKSEFSDPLGEELYKPVECITHKYPDRVVLYTTHNCPVYCRFCFRKRKVSNPLSAASHNLLNKGIEYIASNNNIRDVIISGGDPLSFSDNRLDDLLIKLRKIRHLEIIRIATRNPVTLPQRITHKLCKILQKHHPIYVNTHFNHLQECTQEAADALNKLVDSGCVLGNQMVLLKNINDNPQMILKMNKWLLKERCKPYYMFQCDPVLGTYHFRTSIESGLNIMDALRGFTSGMAVPDYVIDLPGGGGKVELNRDHIIKKEGKKYYFRNYIGKMYSYEEG